MQAIKGEMLKYLASIAATAIVLLFLLVASVPLMHWFTAEGQQAALDNGRALWESHGITGYEFTIRVDSGAPMTIVVRPGEVVATAVPPGVPATVPAVFDRVTQAIEDAPEFLSVSYHDDYGYPRTIETDPDRGYDGDESQLEISYFRPLAANR